MRVMFIITAILGFLQAGMSGVWLSRAFGVIEYSQALSMMGSIVGMIFHICLGISLIMLAGIAGTRRA